MKFEKPTLSKRSSIGLVVISYCFFAVVLLVTASAIIVGQNDKFILSTPSDVGNKLIEKRVAIVFGAGVYGSRPSPLLRDRLDAAAELYLSGKIDKIIVSGDNRFADYNEPQAMYKYLDQTYQIPDDVLQPDFAGFSTFESCERARKIFGVTKAVLISQRTHLARAIYLCRAFGIEAYGYASKSDKARVSQTIRELGANVRAVFNLYFSPKDSILGNPINLWGPSSAEENPLQKP